MLTWSAAWYDSPDDVMGDSLHHYSNRSRWHKDDFPIVKSLWPLLDEADVVVAHNGDRFDLPKINARFITHDITPPAPYQTIDTLKVARRKFMFGSNKLSYICDVLGVTQKQSNRGQVLWAECCDGRLQAFEEMLEYNRGDIRSLYEVYLKLRPWIVTGKQT